MKEILWLGRGGQGAFTAAKLFGAAYTAHDDSHYALAFPSFGPERRGAPVRYDAGLSGRKGSLTDEASGETKDILRFF